MGDLITKMHHMISRILEMSSSMDLQRWTLSPAIFVLLGTGPQLAILRVLYLLFLILNLQISFLFLVGFDRQDSSIVWFQGIFVLLDRSK
jgi:hypothetical protein